MVGLIGSLRGSSYKIPNSLRFRTSASTYLDKNFTVTGSRTTWTWSGWVKRGTLSTDQSLFAWSNQGGSAGAYFQLMFSTTTTDALEIISYNNTTIASRKVTNAVYRDTSAWYHVVVAFDTTNSTAADRTKIYVNGNRVTDFRSSIDVNGRATNVDPALNYAGYINATGYRTTIGVLDWTGPASHNLFDGYMAEVNFIDGQALAPSSFGRISGSTGVWSPKKYTGTYGTNGFYLNFKDNSAATSAAIGKDYSGKYNNWTPNNISLIAGTSYDSMADSPTPYGDSLQYFTGTRYPYNALNFRSSALTYLGRTPASAGNRKTWTWSGWVKRNKLGTHQGLIASQSTSSQSGYNTTFLIFNTSDNLFFRGTEATGADQINWTSSAAFRDTSAWYHVIIALDTNQSINNNGLKIYVNGVLQTGTFSSYLQNYNTFINNNQLQYIGVATASLGATEYVYHNDGYLADINFIDGQALTPSSFGETVNGVWKPKTYSGTYGTNGFYLKFNDNSAATATALGKDSAGSNNWTPTNLAVTDVTSTDITSVKLVNPNYGLQFRSSALTTLNRTPTTAGNLTTWTWSGWVKRASNADQVIFARRDYTAGVTDARHEINFINGTIGFGFYQTINLPRINLGYLQTNSLYQDFSAWYHVVAVWDTSNSIQTDRVRLYVNGTRVTSFATNSIAALNQAGIVNTTSSHVFGVTPGGSANLFDGYLAEVNFIDGQALTPSSFGETVDGTWVPKSYTGTYGTNGFYLNFADRSAMTAAAIGNDASSNSNNWTPNNFVISDAIDYTAKTARGNYPTLNPLSIVGGSVSLAAGNTLVTVPNSSNQGAMATMVCNGKNYFETQGNAFGSNVIAICCTTINLFAANNVEGITYNSDGRLYINGVQTTVPSYTSADVIGVTVDTSTREIKVYKNNVQIGTTAIAAGTDDLIFGVVGSYLGTGSGSTYVNFGQRPFVYTPPAGFKALNTYNLPAPSITNAASYMAATTYTGTGVALSINNITNNKTFKPDLVWIKSRSAATNHALYDSVRGVQKDLVSNDASAETTQTAGLLAFNDNGFNIGNFPKLNTNAATYVAWQWKAGGSTVANTAGTIASQVNANPAAGFSVAIYTSTGVAGATVGHGLGAVPSMIITRRKDSTSDWAVWHKSLAESNTLFLNRTEGSSTFLNRFASSGFTSDVFKFGSDTNEFSAGSCIAYCFAEVAGYSKFGSYTGNGSNDGPFVYCGFRPRWAMIRSTVGDGPGGTRWIVIDASRDSTNPTAYALSPNFASEEIVIAHWKMDFVSNGFKIRSYLSNDREWNYPSSTYIFAAFAETPFKYSLAR